MHALIQTFKDCHTSAHTLVRTHARTQTHLACLVNFFNFTFLSYHSFYAVIVNFLCASVGFSTQISKS